MREAIRTLWERYRPADALVAVVTGVVVVQAEFPAVVAPVLSLLARLPPLSPGRAAQVPTLCLLLLLVYSLLPTVYPSWMGQPVRRNRLVRLAMAGLGLVIAQGLYLAAAGAGQPGPFAPITTAALFGYGAVGCAVLALGFAASQDRPLTDANGPAMRTVLRQMGVDRERAYRREAAALEREYPWRHRANAVVVVVAIGAMNLVPVVALGATVGILSRFYPLLELLAVARLIAGRIGSVRGRDWPRDELPDVEGEVYSRLDLLRTMYGWGAFLPAVFGLGVTMVVYSSMPIPVDPVKWGELGRAVAELASSPSTAAAGYALAKGVAVVSHTAFAVTPLLVAVYSLWFWLRTLRRFPAVVRQGRAVAYPEPAADATLSPRPRGYLLPVLPLMVLYANHATQPRPYLGVALDGLAFLLPWVVAVALVGGSVAASRGRDTYADVGSAQRETLLPGLVPAAAAFLYAPSASAVTEFLLSGLAVYLFASLLVAVPVDAESRRRRRWFAVFVGGVAVLAAAGVVPVPVAVGIGVVTVALWVHLRGLTAVTE
jgi:hypothetical protein